MLLANYDKTKGANKTIGSYDTVVFRVMHGWMKIEEITHERLVEAVELAHELLGAETVVLMVGGAIRQNMCTVLVPTQWPVCLHVRTPF